MRILICSNAYPPNFVGGAELIAHEQAKALIRLGHTVQVFTGEPNSGRPHHAYAHDIYEGIAIHRIALQPEDYSPEHLNFLHPTVEHHFSTVLQNFMPDVVHCHNLMGLSVKLPLLARQNGAITICTLHDFWGFCLLNTAVRTDGMPCDDVTQCYSCVSRIHDGRKLYIPMRLRKDFMALALDQVDCFIAPSRHIAQRYMWAGWSDKQIEIVPNGIDIERFKPTPRFPPNAPLRITYAGYFGVHKGVTTLLDALAKLKTISVKCPTPVVLQLAGEGPALDTYKTRIQHLNLQSNVRFLGKIASENMPKVYAQSDIIILPSIWDENQPVCLMEAMASGLPVIATRKGGIPELIEHGQNGLMFNAHDATGLAKHIYTLIANPDLRRQFGSNGRRRIEHLNNDSQASLVVSIYEKISKRLAFREPRDPVHKRKTYLVIGNLRRNMRGEAVALADQRHNTRRFLPRSWISDTSPHGILLTGIWWSALHWLHIRPIIPLPKYIIKVIFKNTHHILSQGKLIDINYQDT